MRHRSQPDRLGGLRAQRWAGVARLVQRPAAAGGRPRLRRRTPSLGRHALGGRRDARVAAATWLRLRLPGRPPMDGDPAAPGRPALRLAGRGQPSLGLRGATLRGEGRIARMDRQRALPCRSLRSPRRTPESAQAGVRPGRRHRARRRAYPRADPGPELSRGGRRLPGPYRARRDPLRGAGAGLQRLHRRAGQRAVATDAAGGHLSGRH